MEGDNERVVVPTRESSVVNPTEMIAVTDATLSSFQAHEFNGRILGAPDLSIALIDPSLWLEIPLSIARRNPSVTERFAIEQKATSRRHDGTFNVGFVDGHVDRFKIPELFGREEESLRRWNNDNQPHLKLIPPEFRF